MRLRSFVAATVAFASTIDAQVQYASKAAADVAVGKAMAKTSSPTSSIPGKTFNRFVNIWLENTDFDMAAGDPSLAWVATQGITLTNYLALTHPSQPNYIGAVGGSTHWVFGDWFVRISRSQRTIVDLLDAKGVSWSEYQEDMPYSGFQGDYVNQKNGANDYVRKHNPLISYDSVSEHESRIAKIKNLTMFYEDLKNDALPQWMFITPNMTSCGHDSSVTVAGTWTRSFLEPLLRDKNFMKNTLVLLTFDETESYSSDNRVFSHHGDGGE
ncbi:putative acid phosphatase [Hyphodiscus hymeniophilus]|uniref:Acid phosphatase n=1 Tax=Hyphodiscus hymeniophilus TaxID=353542 RepID=A0A9P6SLD7_9HELO|nr:putative acid phosphatase [Hyphodiscus hymeniophilus]